MLTIFLFNGDRVNKLFSFSSLCKLFQYQHFHRKPQAWWVSAPIQEAFFVGNQLSFPKLSSKLKQQKYLLVPGIFHSAIGNQVTKKRMPLMETAKSEYLTYVDDFYQVEPKLFRMLTILCSLIFSLHFTISFPKYSFIAWVQTVNISWYLISSKVLGNKSSNEILRA